MTGQESSEMRHEPLSPSLSPSPSPVLCGHAIWQEERYLGVQYSMKQSYAVLYSSSLRRIELSNHEDFPLLDSFQTLGIHCCAGQPGCELANAGFNESIKHLLAKYLKEEVIKWKLFQILHKITTDGNKRNWLRCTSHRELNRPHSTQSHLHGLESALGVESKWIIIRE
jgi:hypothetical protein